mmetsp:Transcript_7261/g.15708  ORF Transcript_7261/g.15708 Transcript_7261/m.15708 type:complete len:229 (-) Transcript_7261:65-751(-)
MAAALKLLYFDIRGKGEPIRLALAYAGLDFEDCRLSREAFMQMKTSGELRFGQVPALVVTQGGESKTLVQTNAIMRYIGKLAGPKCSLYPTDALKAAEVDAIADQVSDLTTPVVCATYQDRYGFGVLGGPDGEGTKQVQESLFADVMPKHYGLVSTLLETSPTGWLAGTSEPSYADFAMGVQLENFRTNKVVRGADLLYKFPKIEEFIGRMHALPAVKAWYEKHPPAS